MTRTSSPTPTARLTPDYWKTHQHFRIWDATDGKSYYNAALDYSFPEVRERYRDEILEVGELVRRRRDRAGLHAQPVLLPALGGVGEARPS